MKPIEVLNLSHYPPNAVTTGFDGEVNFLWRYFDISADSNDWPCPARTVVELNCCSNQRDLN